MAESDHTFKKRYWSHVNRTKTCWLWTGYVGSFGYGVISYKGVMTGAHRVSFLMRGIIIPPGMCALHRCDTPACVRPSHLWLGTQTENMADMTRKGRRNLTCNRGENCGNAKLTTKQVLAIRKEIGSEKEVAKRYGIKKSQVGMIRRRQRWQHLP